MLLRAAALLEADPDLAGRLQVVILGAPSGRGLDDPDLVPRLAAHLGIRGIVAFRPPAPREDLAEYYRAADLTVVPSHNESFGLVAVESQAAGTPVVAAAVGGLPTAVADGVSGVLVDGHDPAAWARILGDLLRSRPFRRALTAGARPHAERFSWNRTVDGLLAAYHQAIGQRRDRSLRRCRAVGTGP